ncbi:hypothetical protein GGR88_002029 [Sphingomonas jejuensis]|uniref:DUF3089 domain-containing protein n=1 Tax=Sphingomonas jejuensis TaxID=904715 RepID=A0ABX0XMQ0_9SPHN|nr:DUF3089 domain-containing protein [Sphingomonas jejuensis]NJC34515.1 hypothetical protein [Sphingomonas jejuensis]
MTTWMLLAAAAAAAVQAQPTPTPSTPAAPPVPAAAMPAAPDYQQDGAWLCLPGKTDACSQVLPTVALNPNGYGSVGEARPNPDAAADCFYVYPTVSRDPGVVSDLVAGQEEIATAYAQVARFSEQCRLFAPIYRQLTLATLNRAATSGDQREVVPAFELAYQDVKAAWTEFRRRSGDRPFVLIGHSQGSVHLSRLIAEEIDGKPAAEKMLSAILLGWNIEVPEGEVVGGTFRQIPLCTEEGQTGCVITYVTYRADAPPPEVALFGRAATAGRTVACTNPGALNGGGPAQFTQAPVSALLDSYWFAARPTNPPIRWSSEGQPSVPFVRTEGLVEARCVHDGAVGYLALSIPPTPDDARTDQFPGDIVIGGQPQPGWGTHLADMPVAQGDLIRLVAEQVGAFGQRR